ncbi:MAG: rhamnulokinase [Planctomycetaceae bacterium]|nr:rhamnulokinase [Planctomycetaceae bacterium]MBQ2820810.1 rhamnulokinase [Thermoguttaceae bacterium]
MSAKNYLAIDMGASSGRHVLGNLKDKKLTLKEIWRFENGGTDVGGTLCWDLPALWKNVQAGLRAAADELDGEPLRSVGVDTWGVDFAMLDQNDQLLANPVTYRDNRTDGFPEAAFATVSRSEIFARTGLQFMQFNTLYQLIAMKKEDNPLLNVGKSFLQIPDLFHWLLSGKKANEFTNATTTQFFNPLTGDWAWDLLEAFGIPTHFLGKISPPGTNLGPLRQSVQEFTGLGPDVNVVLPGTHDTASAVMAVPAESMPGTQPNWAYVSLGTWALMGIESPKPIVNETMLKLNFTNEGGVGNTWRVLKNITGMWILQECKRIWNSEGKDWNWDQLTQMADAAPSLKRFINAEDARFFAPGNMVNEIVSFCRETGQSVPENEAEVLKCAVESIAMRFRDVFRMCEEINGQKIETIHIVGGGTRNRQLCQMTANATGRKVVTGPIEATAIGNIMIQAIEDGAVKDIAEAREIIRNSFPMEVFLPRNTEDWENAYARYSAVKES